jgi:hypothetical protein
MGRTCVCGAEELDVDVEARTVQVNGTTLAEGDVVSIDGSTGEVFAGRLPVVASPVAGVTQAAGASRPGVRTGGRAAGARRGGLRGRCGGRTRHHGLSSALASVRNSRATWRGVAFSKATRS